MTVITATLVKTLRDRTGAGIMACRTTRAETGGDLDAAVARLREPICVTAFVRHRVGATVAP